MRYEILRSLKIQLYYNKEFAIATKVEHLQIEMVKCLIILSEVHNIVYIIRQTGV